MNKIYSEKPLVGITCVKNVRYKENKTMKIKKKQTTILRKKYKKKLYKGKKIFSF